MKRATTKRAAAVVDEEKTTVMSRHLLDTTLRMAGVEETSTVRRRWDHAPGREALARALTRALAALNRQRVAVSVSLAVTFTVGLLVGALSSPSASASASAAKAPLVAAEGDEATIEIVPNDPPPLPAAGCDAPASDPIATLTPIEPTPPAAASPRRVWHAKATSVATTPRKPVATPRRRPAAPPGARSTAVPDGANEDDAHAASAADELARGQLEAPMP